MTSAKALDLRHTGQERAELGDRGLPRGDRIYLTKQGPKTSAVTPPVVLRNKETRRLVFKPTVIERDDDSGESVKGTFIYQAKRKTDDWVDVDTISLAQIKSDECYQLRLDSAELQKLYIALKALIEYMAKNGMKTGSRQLVAVDSSFDLNEILATMKDVGGTKEATEVLKWLAQRNTSELAGALSNRSDDLISQLDEALSLARLRDFITEAEQNIGNDSEPYWHQLFKRNTWILTQLTATPVVIYDNEVYVGGKTLRNRGGNYVDFLYRNRISNGALLVEIKTPLTPLTDTRSHPHRNNTYACSRELAGGVQQLLQDVQVLREGHVPRDGFNFAHPRCLLIAGTLAREAEPERRASFELFRTSLKDMEIITYDELVDKARILLDVFDTSPTSD